LLALMELQASRLRARTSGSGEPVLLLDQNRALWDGLLIQRGLLALERAEKLREERGPYTLQAGIAACHARARSAEQTDWQQIVLLYEALAEGLDSPVVRLNHAVAVGMAFGPERALPLVDALVSEPSLLQYYLLPSARADLLFKLSRYEEAHDELQKALSLAQNARDRAVLSRRIEACRALLGTGTPRARP
jgi:predicted RNA polymerase sigma factor